MESSIELPAYALPMFNSYHRRTFLSGGRWSVKSHTAGRKGLVSMMQHPGDVLCTRQYQNSIDASIYTLMVNLIDANGWRDTLFRVNSQEIMSIKTGAVAKFKGLERNLQSIKSMENLRMLIAEECSEYTEEAFSVISPTFRVEPVEQIYIWNPQRPDDAIEHMRSSAGPDDLVIFVTWRDAPFLNTAFYDEYERSKRQWPYLMDHIWEGDWLPASANNPFLFDNIESAFHREYRDADIATPYKIMGVDPAYTANKNSDYTAITIWDEFANGVHEEHWQVSDLQERQRLIVNCALEHNVFWALVDTTGGAGIGIPEALREANVITEEVRFNATNRAEMVEYLALRLAEGRISIKDMPLLYNELRKFNRTPEGRYEALPYEHDDLVFSAMLAFEGLRRKYG